MNKKAIELSANFLVVIIISLVVFIMGIIFVNKIIFSAEKKVAEMDTLTKEELERLLGQGEKVAMPFFQKTVIHGKTASFGIGILNTINDPSKFHTDFLNEFKIIVEFDEAFDKNDNRICDAGSTGGCGSDPDGAGTPADNGWLAYNHNEHEIEANEQGRYTIAISTPTDAVAGVYIFNVAVCYVPADAPNDAGEDNYDSATTVCGGTYGTDGNSFGYYHLQKIWLSVK